MSEVIRNEGGIQGQGVSSNEKVHRTNGYPFGFQFMPNLPVMRWAGNGFIIINIERREQFTNGGHFGFVLAAVASTKLQFGYSYGG